MIQLNLLPDVKLEYIRTQRTRRLIFSVSAVVTIGAVVILGFLLGINGLQKKHLSDLTKDIKSNTSKLKSKKDINKILTVQNQLESLTDLHDSKPAATRLFTYLNQVTPDQVGVSRINIDFKEEQKVTITGAADALSSVNKYIDTLKAVTFSAKNSEGTETGLAFSNVVLVNFGVSATTRDPNKAATFAIELIYDKNIFDITKSVKLSVPTSQSNNGADQPLDLFQETGPTNREGN